VLEFVQESACLSKGLYDDGHLLEFAIFDKQALAMARVNDYRISVI
jgi:hypothetical protein